MLSLYISVISISVAGEVASILEPGEKYIIRLLSKHLGVKTVGV